MFPCCVAPLLRVTMVEAIVINNDVVNTEEIL